jgi:hypothetical protein
MFRAHDLPQPQFAQLQLESAICSSSTPPTVPRNVDQDRAAGVPTPPNVPVPSGSFHRSR